MAVGVHDIKETDDGRVVHFFEQGDFADGGARYAFIFCFETDLFEGDDALIGRGEVARFVDDAVGAWRRIALVQARTCGVD